MRKQLEIIKTQVGQEETLVFDLMSESDGGQKNLVRLSERLKQIEQEWDKERNILTAKAREMEQNLQSLEQKRSAQITRLKPEDISLYDSLKTQKAGNAIAKVEQGRCMGCRLNLSINQLQRLRTENTPRYCDNCGRMLLLE